MTDITLQTEENTEMMKLPVESIDSLSIFRLNPVNVRNWDLYSVSAKIDSDGKLRFIADNKNAPKEVQELLDSLIVRQLDEENRETVIVRLIEPLLVAPKTDGVYTLLSGNSRVTLIRNSISAIENDLTAEQQQEHPFIVEPIRYETAKGYNPSMLFGLQITANSVVPLTAYQKARVIGLRMEQLIDSDPDKYSGKAGAGLLKKQISTEFNLNPQSYNIIRAVVTKFDPLWIKLLDQGEIQNLEVAYELQRILDHPQLGDAVKKAEILWDLILEKVKADKKTNIPGKSHVSAVKKELEAEFGEIEEKDEDSDLSDTDPTTAESTQDEDGEGSKNASKLAEIERLRNLDRSVLNDETVNAISEFVDFVANLDPVQYDLDDAIKLRLMIPEFQNRLSKMKTEAQKTLIKAEKEAAKEAAKAAKEAAKAEEAQSTESVSTEI